MRTNSLKSQLESGTPIVGSWLSFDSQHLGESLSHMGFDTVTVDVQHGMFGLETAISLLRAIGSGPAIPLARCSSHDPAEIGKLLDAGAYGIICPNIDTREETERFVRACLYPPQGSRSYGPARGLLYGGPDYVAQANDEIMKWAMIESSKAIDNIDSILSVPDLDGIYVGPKDLALSFGVPPALYLQDETLAIIAELVRKAHAVTKYIGIFAADASEARRLIDIGADFVTPGNDASLIANAASLCLSSLRN